MAKLTQSYWRYKPESSNPQTSNSVEIENLSYSASRRVHVICH